MIFGEVDSMLNLMEKVKKYYESFKRPISSQSLTVRFIQLFEVHGVHRNQIPRFFGHGFTLKDVQDDQSLIVKLDEQVLEAVCKLFAVRREWLDGADEQVHPHHDFYKRPTEFLKFITNLKLENKEGQLDGVLYSPEKPDFSAEAILVLNEIIGSVGNEPIYRYHLCNGWMFAYWKARAYLAACVAIAWKHQVYIKGRAAPKKPINKLSQGEIFLACKKMGTDSLRGIKWYAEDMALLPETFLRDVDPELDNFGVISGLDLWLKLDNQDLMDTGLNEKDARLLFLEAREKYT